MKLPPDAVIADTNVISYAIKRVPVAYEYRRLLVGKRINISFVTAAELHFWAKKAGWGASRCLQLQHFLEGIPVVAFSPGMEQRYAAVMAESHRSGHRMEHADAWIAATALYHGVPLVTHDEGFVYTRDLRLITASPTLISLRANLPVVMRPDLLLENHCRCSL
jgi:predicted nucleic acid-binding protein